MQVRGEFLRPGGRQEREWAKHSYVQLEALKDVDKLVKELTLRLEALKISVRNRQNPPRSHQAFILKVGYVNGYNEKNQVIFSFLFLFNIKILMCVSFALYYQVFV